MFLDMGTVESFIIGLCRSRAGDRQQPDGDVAPSTVVAPMMALVGAKLEVIDVPAHVVTERTGGQQV
jgi:hypothetical protein